MFGAMRDASSLLSSYPLPTDIADEVQDIGSGMITKEEH
jgi:hypothetical protein